MKKNTQNNELENYLDDLLEMSTEELERKDQENFENCLKKLARHGFKLKVFKALSIISLLTIVPIVITYSVNFYIFLPLVISLIFLRMVNNEQRNINLMMAFIEHVYTNSYK